jgi:NifU-like protein involved in Fe-S cluster formation
MRRARSTRPPELAAECLDEAGRFARFGVEVSGGVVTAVRFRASACTTLIAYCEVAAEHVSGLHLTAAISSFRVTHLTRALPSVPAIKHDRAGLAARALMAALLDAARKVD